MSQAVAAMPRKNQAHLASIEQACLLFLHRDRDLARHLHPTVAAGALLSAAQVGIHGMAADAKRQGYLMIAFALTV
jgi:hypothetical protein